MEAPTRPATQPCGPLGAVTSSLLQAAHLFGSRMEAALTGVGLSWAKHGVLTLLVEADEAMTLSELATGQSCVRSNITQLVDRLEVDGFVRRVNDPDDRRVVRAELTSLGRERQAAGARKLDDVQAAFVASLADDERATLVRLLSALG